MAAQRRAVNCAAGGRREGTKREEPPGASKLRLSASESLPRLVSPRSRWRNAVADPRQQRAAVCRVKRAQVAAAPAASAAQRGWTAFLIGN